MATLNLRAYTTEISATLSGISKTAFSRTFDWYLDGVFQRQDFIYGTVEPTNLTNRFYGLSPGTTHTVKVIVKNDEAGWVVATFEESITTQSDTPTTSLTPYIYTNGQWRSVTPYIHTNGQWRSVTPAIFKEQWIE